MMNIHAILIPLILLLLSCQQKVHEKQENKFSPFIEKANKKRENKFSSFVEKFMSKELPYSFDEEYMRNLDETTLLSIDTILVGLFIEKNKTFAGGVKLHDMCRYLPLYRFSISEGIQAVVLKQICGAGGVDDLYYLITYTDTGDELSRLLLSMEVGDCGNLEIKTGNISQTMEIETCSKVFENDCGEENEYILQNTTVEKFRITEKGKIVKR